MDFVTKFEKALRKRYQHLKTELAKIEHLIDAFEKGAKRGAKPTGRSKLSAAGRKRISMAQKARWARARRDKSQIDSRLMRMLRLVSLRSFLY